MKHQLISGGLSIIQNRILEKKNMTIMLYTTDYSSNVYIKFPELKEFSHVYKEHAFYRYRVATIQIDKERDIITEIKLVDKNNTDNTVEISYLDVSFGVRSVNIKIQAYVSDKLVHDTKIVFSITNDTGVVKSLTYSNECFDDSYKNDNFVIAKDRFSNINGKEKLPEKITKITDIVTPRSEESEETVIFTTINDNDLITIMTRERDFSKVIRFSIEGEDDFYETVRTKTITEIELTEEDIKNDIIKKEREVSDMLGYSVLSTITTYYTNGYKKIEQIEKDSIQTKLVDEFDRLIEHNSCFPKYYYISNDPIKAGNCELSHSIKYKYGSFEGVEIMISDETRNYTRDDEVINKRENRLYRITLEKKDSSFPAMFEYV